MGPVVDDLAQLESFEGSAEEYDALMERLTVGGGFAVWEHADEYLEQIGLYEARNRATSTLSGGERTLLAIARLFIHEPKLLLLDEPTNHLDYAHKQVLFRLLQKWSGAAIVVTHDEDLLDFWPTTVWHLDRAKLRIFHGDWHSFTRELAIEQKQQKQTAPTCSVKGKSLFHKVRRKVGALPAAASKASKSMPMNPSLVTSKNKEPKKGWERPIKNAC